MDNILDKFELFDFFSVLLPGMSLIFFLYYMDFPILAEGGLPTSQTFKVIIFILASYILGTLLQEIASFMDEKYFKIRKNAREKFLDSNKQIFKGEELQEVRKTANSLLEKDISNNQFTNSECSKVYFECKAHLENNNKMDEANKYDAVFEMSRNFIICNICVLICLFITMIMTSACTKIHITIIIYILISTIIFIRRMIRYSEMRVRKVLRRYIDLKG